VTVVDTSAIFAILLQEPDAHRYSRAVEDDLNPAISSASWLEASAVALRRGGSPLLRELQNLIENSAFDIVPFTSTHAQIAIEAYRRYGRGVGRPGCLNFGDCFSYALAKSLDEPLLYKGDDFAKTDIRSAL
jgi:ribonuclease VapC